MEGEREMERAEWKTTARSTKDREKRAFSLLPALRTWLINHLYAINHQESTAGLTRSIQMPLKLVERRVRHGHTTWPSVEGTNKNHLSAWPRCVSVSKPLWWLYRRPCHDHYNANPSMQSYVVVGGSAIFVILYANLRISTKSLPCFVAASDCNRSCLNKDELNWISHIYHPKLLWKRRKHRCSTWTKGPEAVNKVIDSPMCMFYPNQCPQTSLLSLERWKPRQQNTHK